MSKKLDKSLYPGWDEGLFYWAISKVNKERYRIPSYLSMDDCLGEFYLIYLSAREKKPKASKKQMMSYLKIAVDHWIIRQSRKGNHMTLTDLDNTGNGLLSVDSFLAILGYEEHPSGFFKCLLRQSRGEIRELIKLFFTDNGKDLLSANYEHRFKDNGHRETNNDVLCRLLDIDPKINLFQRLKDYFYGSGS